MASNSGVPIAYIENYSKTLNRVSNDSRKKLVTALSVIDYSQSIPTIRDAVIAVMQLYCAASSTLAARLAAEFFDGLRVRAVGEKLGASIVTGRNPDATSEAVRAFVQLLVDDDPREEFIKRCADRADYELRRAANMCVYENAKRDPLKPKYARVPIGDETCAWCMLLASYGFTSQMKEVVQHTHENCDCRVVVAWDDVPRISGDDANQRKYDDLYREVEKVRTGSEMSDELKQHIKAAKDEHEARRKAGKTTTKWTTLNEQAIIARWLHPELH